MRGVLFGCRGRVDVSYRCPGSASCNPSVGVRLLDMIEGKGINEIDVN
jgi:hypothetical protein